MTTIPSDNDESEIRRLEIRDAEAGFQLSSAAGWNQSVADWRMMLAAGEAFGMFAGERLIGSALYLPFPPDIAWVSMVLVDDAFRRRGIGSRLTTQCVQRIEERGLVPVLDATDAGRAVYSRMGFVAGPVIPRLVASDARGIRRSGATSGVTATSDMEAVLALDGEAFGGAREQILANIAGRADDACVVVSDGEGPAGYGMLRRGRQATQIGPVVVRPDLAGTSRFEPVATKMLTELGRRAEGTVIVDVPERHGAIRALLEAAGFEPKRRFIRMHRGATLTDAHPALTLVSIAAIGGPAIG